MDASERWSWRRDGTEIIIESCYGAEDVCGIHNANEEEDEQKACLLAASPELFAACKAVLEGFRYEKGRTIMEEWKMKELLAEALSKAEGK